MDTGTRPVCLYRRAGPRYTLNVEVSVLPGDTKIRRPRRSRQEWWRGMSPPHENVIFVPQGAGDEGARKPGAKSTDGTYCSENECLAEWAETRQPEPSDFPGAKAGRNASVDPFWSTPFSHGRPDGVTHRVQNGIRRYVRLCREYQTSVPCVSMARSATAANLGAGHRFTSSDAPGQTASGRDAMPRRSQLGTASAALTRSSGL